MNDPLVEALLQMNLFTQEVLDIEASAAKEHGIPVLEQLLADSVVSPKEVACAKAAHYGISFVDLHSIKPAVEAVEAIPKDLALRYHILPFSLNGDTVCVAISDPADLFRLDALQGTFGKSFEAHMADPAALDQALKQYYSEMDTELVQLANTAVPDVVITAEDAPLIKLVDQIFADAYARRASDIHFEPMPGEFQIRFRIDGVLHNSTSPALNLQAPMISRLKIQAGMSIDVKRLPQDGRIRKVIAGKQIDMRVSCIPTNYGESIVIRLLDKGNLSLSLNSLGFMPGDLQNLQDAISAPDGMILVTGPTGSGKTTTLYSVLNTLNQEDTKILTVEDPVEYLLSGVNQVQVNEAVGMSFANVLRSMLRQSPNIIMLGEIRDAESANIAMNAALTGHLVFSTLHTNDAPGAVTRLIDMGVKPFLIASAARALMAQRLVRKVCNSCAKPYIPPQRELDRLGLKESDLTSNIKSGTGCSSCFKTGYKGRLGIYELAIVDDALQKLIYQRATIDQLRKQARLSGMKSLREDGISKIYQGLTTPLEVIAATLHD